jgi:hypothetical protein
MSAATFDPALADSTDTCQECHVPDSPWMPEAGRYLCVAKCQPRHRVAAERAAEVLKWETARVAWEAAKAERARLEQLDPEVQRRIGEAIGIGGAVFGSVTTEVLSVHVDSCNTHLITFDALDRLHRAFGTRAINLKHHRGTYYSDVTPGGPDNVSIEITGWSLPDTEEV